MCDIVSTMAWCCGFEDGCKVGWHMSNYWIDSDGTYTVDRYADGDHEGIDEEELPTPDDIDKSWREYAAYVSASGLDPLGNYTVKRTTKKKERYTATFKHMTWAGVVLCEVKRRGEKLVLRDLPERVAEYLWVERKDESSAWIFNGGDWAYFTSLDCVKALPVKKGVIMPEAVVTFTLEYDCPRPAATVTAELRRIARRHIAEKIA